MKLAGTFHLTYCSNIHPGETWAEVRAALGASLPEVRRQLGWTGPFGVGLRLSAAAAETLERPDELTAFRRFLADGDYYVFTINGFPYGAFHRARVKEQVYLPDWRSGARVVYTNRLARILAALLADRPDIEGSVSTVPGAFKAHVTSDADVSAIAAGLLRHAAELVAIRAATGRTIVLAIEPEPACFIETTADAIAFFRDRLFNERAALAAGVDVEDVRRHIGVCCDACHMAVEFENPAVAFARLRDAGIRIGKVQVSSALHVGHPMGAAARATLGRFAEDTYLHQAVVDAPEGLVRFTDLPEALAARAAPAGDCRVHFHVPIFLAHLGDLDTTQSYLATVLDLVTRDRLSPHLEVETYTWDVLPAEYRSVDMPTAIARELAWARDRIES